MTARAEWIPSKLALHCGYEIFLDVRSVTIIDTERRAIILRPQTASAAAELSIALKRAQRRMDQIFREMRAVEDAK